MKKFLLVLITIVTLSNVSFSQDSKVYHAIKYGAYMEYFWSPVGQTDASFYSTNSVQDSIVYSYDRYTAVSLFNFVYSFRFDVYEPSDNFGIGINASPSLGVTISDDGIGSLNLPGYLSLNFGAGSTYSTASNFGGFIGVGYEFNKINLIASGDDIYEDCPTCPTFEKPSSAWAQPLFIGGVRWWSGRDVLYEVSFKYGFGTNGDLPSYINAGSPKTIQLSFGRFLNY